MEKEQQVSNKFLSHLKAFFGFFFKNSIWSFLINFLLVIGLTSGIILSFFFWYLPSATNKGQTLTVPDLSSMDLEEVKTLLEDKQLRYEISDSTYRDGLNPLAIISQTPAPNELVKLNRKIYLTVNSVIPPTTNIPDIMDGSLKSAQLLLDSYGIKVREVEYVPFEFANVVIKVKYNGEEISKEDIRAGYEITKGDSIDLEVGDGLGVDELEIPILVGQPLDEVETLLAGYGLLLGNIEYVESEEEVGVVVRQSPEPETDEEGEPIKVKLGSSIDLWVSGYFPKEEN